MYKTSLMIMAANKCKNQKKMAVCETRSFVFGTYTLHNAISYAFEIGSGCFFSRDAKLFI